MIWRALFSRKPSLFDRLYRRGLMIYNRDRAKALAFANAHVAMGERVGKV